MANKERPLPKPPNKAFGRKKNFERQEEEGPLVADRMAQAAAEGRLDEFLKQEMPDNEYARNLASMMMGMTGMTGAGITRPEAETGEQHAPGEASSAEVPEDVREAIMGGDVQGLMGMLRREHARRNPESPLTADQKTDEQSSQQAPPAAQPAIDKELIDALVRIASDNSVTLDWIMLRAIKLYVQEYEKTGRL